mmetsp:Transcript_104981/g.181022  ORF Transcript_104981/g.181022 Transcript_104981/m.181022 type:complete len:106 (-) Transcript_104981:1333-1650(-)
MPMVAQPFNNYSVKRSIEQGGYGCGWSHARCNLGSSPNPPPTFLNPTPPQNPCLFPNLSRVMYTAISHLNFDCFRLLHLRPKKFPLLHHDLLNTQQRRNPDLLVV